MKREIVQFTTIDARAEFMARYAGHPGHTATALLTIEGPNGPLFPVLFTTYSLD
jgi:hypothetical protein